MPKFDPDKLFDYLIVIVIVVGPILAAVAKKLIAIFSPKPPELLKPSAPSKTVAREARPVPPIELAPTARPAIPPVRVPAPPQPPARQPRPVARRVAHDDADPTTAARQSRPRADAPMALEAMVEDHLGHLTSNIEREAGHTSRDVKRRLEHAETSVGTLKVRQSGDERKIAAPAATDSTPIRRLTRQGLRRAIVLREILGPPIALRAPDES